MITNLKIYLRYDWPIHFILLFTNWLPDNVIFYRLRGKLVKHFLGSCGHSLNVGRNVTFYNPSQIHLGNFVHIFHGCILIANSSIILDDEVMLGPYCVLASGNHTRQDYSFQFGPIQSGNIHINKGTWLGAHVVVTAGSDIGSGSLVAAGAVVRGKFVQNSMIGGVPATIIKPFDDQ